MKLYARKLGKKQKAALNALADGIECGAALIPRQSSGSLLSFQGMEDGGDVYGVCALGAALACAWNKQGKPLPTLENKSAWDEFRSTGYNDILGAYGVENKTGLNLIQRPQLEPEVNPKTTDYLRVVDGDNDLAELIWHLNDWLHWTPKRIADFLRSAE